MNLKNSFFTFCASVALITACDADSNESRPGKSDPGAVSLRPYGGGTSGGVFLNTSVIGADELDLNKLLYAEVQLVKIEIKVGNKLKTLDQTWSVEGEMFGKIGGTTYRGSAFQDAALSVVLHTAKYPNQPVTYTVSAYSAAAGQLPRYTLKYREGGVDKYLCATDSIEQAKALVLDSLSVDKVTGDISNRPSTLYLGCASGAVGKAPTWGYTPWDLGLADFEAMVRMVRADYCGDGVSWTVPGRAVTIEDVWGINSLAAQAGATEGVWGPSGLLCLTQPRDPAIAASTVVCGGAPVPTCPVDVSLTTYPDALALLKSAT